MVTAMSGTTDEQPWMTGTQSASCRHCGAKITRQPQVNYWLDYEGWTACVKAPSITSQPVLHQPVPAGLEGSVSEHPNSQR